MQTKAGNLSTEMSDALRAQKPREFRLQNAEIIDNLPTNSDEEAVIRANPTYLIPSLCSV
jgi:hypothetical protein